MIFLPYKLDVNLYRVPFLTVAVCIACLVTFVTQLQSQRNYVRDINAYCRQGAIPNLQAILQRVGGDGEGCAEVFQNVRGSDDPQAVIEAMAGNVRGLDFYSDAEQDLQYKQATLSRGYEAFNARVPRQLTDKLAYRPEHYDFVTMLTSTFAHASWDHLLGNLFFFFIFASCVECVLGPLHFALTIGLMAVVTSLAYSYSVAGADALPTVGLSGVAMGMMALLTALLPRAQIWCFFWILLYMRRFTVPVILIALWYVGWNVYDMMHDDGSTHIDYMAHVSGAATGAVVGMLYRVLRPERLESVTLGEGG